MKQIWLAKNLKSFMCFHLRFDGGDDCSFSHCHTAGAGKGWSCSYNIHTPHTYAVIAMVSANTIWRFGTTLFLSTDRPPDKHWNEYMCSSRFFFLLMLYGCCYWVSSSCGSNGTCRWSTKGSTTGMYSFVSSAHEMFVRYYSVTPLLSKAYIYIYMPLRPCIDIRWKIHCTI